MSCGKCGQPFNLLDHLYDEHPERAGRRAQDYGPETPPVLGDGQDLAADAELARILASEPAAEPRPGKPWRIVFTVLLLITSAHLAWFFWDQLPGPPKAFHDPASIRLVSRDFHPHPSRPDVLVLSASFVNLASEPQSFPRLSVTLLDADDRPLAHREFQPGEYLPQGVDYDAPLNPQVHVPLLLEFADPGDKAVGFELEFR